MSAANVLRPSGYLARVTGEVRELKANPPDGVHAWPRDSDSLHAIADNTGSQSSSSSSAAASSSSTVAVAGFWIDAVITGPDASPYAAGSFRVECCLPRDYPFTPPHCRFVTHIYHPNIDATGRICVDILKTGPESGKWKAQYNLRVVLATIRQLLMEPNADDPLDADIASEYKSNRVLFARKARAATAKHATTSATDAATVATGQSDTATPAEQEQPKPEGQRQQPAKKFGGGWSKLALGKLRTSMASPTPSPPPTVIQQPAPKVTTGEKRPREEPEKESDADDERNEEQSIPKRHKATSLPVAQAAQASAQAQAPAPAPEPAPEPATAAAHVPNSVHGPLPQQKHSVPAKSFTSIVQTHKFSSVAPAADKGPAATTAKPSSLLRGAATGFGRGQKSSAYGFTGFSKFNARK
ncbi:hypothetical protein RI367_005880 [Sorochytrium milnesiophthora]